MSRLLASGSWVQISPSECVVVLAGNVSCVKIDERKARERGGGELAKFDENRRASMKG